MKRVRRSLLIISGALVALGVVVCCISMVMGFRMQSFSDGSLFVDLPIYFGGGRDWDSEYRADGQYASDAGQITGLNLDWTAGQVSIEIYDGTEIRFQENGSGAISQDDSLCWGIDGGVLYIQEFRPGTGTNKPAKTLEVYLPKTLQLQKLAIDSTSADLTCTEVNAESVKIDITSGTLRWNGAFTAMELSATSGDLYVENTGSGSQLDANATSGLLSISGDFDAVEFDTTSGDATLSGRFAQVEGGSNSGQVEILSSVCPDALKLNTTSGDVTLTLPQQSSFSLEADTSSGDLRSDLPLQMHDDTYVCGDGGAAFEIDTTSGNITLHTLAK